MADKPKILSIKLAEETKVKKAPEWIPQEVKPVEKPAAAPEKREDVQPVKLDWDPVAEKNQLEKLVEPAPVEDDPLETLVESKPVTQDELEKLAESVQKEGLAKPIEQKPEPVEQKIAVQPVETKVSVEPVEPVKQVERKPIIKSIREEEDFSRILDKKRDVVSEYREAAVKDMLPPKVEPDEPLSHAEVLARIDAQRKNSFVGRIKGFLRLG